MISRYEYFFAEAYMGLMQGNQKELKEELERNIKLIVKIRREIVDN